MPTIAGSSVHADLNGWRVQTNVWNPENLVYGTDYTLSVTYNGNNFDDHPTYSWNFPPLTQTNYYHVHAYPEIMFGGSPWWGGQLSSDPLQVFPIRVSDLSNLTIKYDLAITGDSRGHNVAFEIFLTNTPNGSSNNITNEIMVWFHRGMFSPGGSQVGTYSDPNFTGAIFNATNWNAGTGAPGWTYTAFAANADDLSGQIDFTAMLSALKNMGIIQGNEYIAGLELGAEVAAGQGSLTVNKLEYDVKTASGPNTILGGTTGTDGADRIIGSADNDTLSGGAGNDTLYGFAGNDILNGGDGVDTAVYSANRSAYTITSNSNGSTTISGPDGTDTLTNVEFAQFADQTISLASDDYAGSTATTGAVRIGGSIAGNIEIAGDHDWFAVTLTAGHSYEFDLQGQHSGAGTLIDPALWLRDNAGNQISYNDDIGGGNWDSRITYTATASGTFYLDAASRGGPGTYQMLASEVLPVGSTLSGSNAGATQRYAVTLTAGHTYQFFVQGHPSGNGTLVDPCEWLRDGSGNQISYSDDISSSDWNSRITYTATSSGTYFLDAGSRGGPGTYQVLASEVLPVGGSLTGAIASSGTTERYALTLTAGHTYEFDAQGHPSGNGTLVDPCMWLRDESGNQISYSDDISSSDWDSRITYTATSSGTYFLDTGSRGGAGTYQMLASEVLTTSGALTGAIASSGTTERYAVTMTAGQSYEFDLQGGPSGHGTLVDPCLWLRDSSGNQLRYSDDISSSDWDSQIVYPATSSGTYFLDAGSRGGPGSYQIVASRVLVVGSPLAGDIQATGETDSFAVFLLAGQTYHFDLQGSPSGHGTLIDPCLWLRDASGNQISYSDDISSSNWDSHIAFTPVTGGVYFLDAAGRGVTGSYLLSAGTGP